jgi:copper chaperone CopZ
MKNVLLLIALTFPFFTSAQSDTNSLSSEVETSTFTVHGNCGMCKTRIEKAAMGVKGVKKATWDAEKQQIEVEYNTKKTKLIAIHEAIAAVGHDTDLVRAKDEVYDNLHGCCKYERE